MKNKKELLSVVSTLAIILLFLVVFGIVWSIVIKPRFFSEPHFKIYTNESGESVEVDEMIVCCLNISNGYDDGSTLFCLPEENLEYFEISCEPLKKEDLTMEWLDWNSKVSAKCFIKRFPIYDNERCEIQGVYNENAFEIATSYEDIKYKFGNYTIEVWDQIK